MTFPRWWQVMYRWWRLRRGRCQHGQRAVYVCTACTKELCKR